MKKIWEKLDQYKNAAAKEKDAQILKTLEEDLLKELSEIPAYNNQEVSQYFFFQCRNIDARLHSVEHSHITIQ
ncbi:MAG: hypothetical protein COX30_03265 [Candidatus Moranbacteria bacterium CG23_combo_of_CG06-09_8_20_14_all_39_10]|nr:MAG: hypothetical protein COX30_03265 [Candidatus Moranbacteria bacterium CG23_combo_of_CG06-09_8_20_14_all_39_10]